MSKSYEGYEILKMIKDKKLKTKQKIICKYGFYGFKEDEKETCILDADDNGRMCLYVLGRDKKEIDSEHIINGEFFILGHPMKLSEAIKTGKNFKYFSWDKFYDLDEAFHKMFNSNISYYNFYDNDVWEVEEE